MSGAFDTGVDFLSHRADIQAGRTYLFEGERGSAKTTFALQFLHRGLVERQSCVLISDHAPERVVAHAASMGLDLSPFLRDGALRIYEIARRDSYAAADLLRELEKAAFERPTARFALEGLGQSPAAGGALADGACALLAKLESARTTCFVTLDLPAPPAVKDALERASAGAFRLGSGPDGLKTFAFLKPASGVELQFQVEPGRGAVEAAKAGAIRFPRHD